MDELLWREAAVNLKSHTDSYAQDSSITLSTLDQLTRFIGTGERCQGPPAIMHSIKASGASNSPTGAGFHRQPTAFPAPARAPDACAPLLALGLQQHVVHLTAPIGGPVALSPLRRHGKAVAQRA